MRSQKSIQGHVRDPGGGGRPLLLDTGDLEADQGEDLIQSLEAGGDQRAHAGEDHIHGKDPTALDPSPERKSEKKKKKNDPKRLPKAIAQAGGLEAQAEIGGAGRVEVGLGLLKSQDHQRGSTRALLHQGDTKKKRRRIRNVRGTGMKENDRPVRRKRAKIKIKRRSVSGDQKVKKM